MYGSGTIKILTLLLVWVSLFAFDSIEVSDSKVKIIQSGYFKTDKYLTPEQAYSVYLKNHLRPLPDQARSLGYSPETYWYAFEVQNDIVDKRAWLDLKHTVDEFAWLYTFQDGRVVQTQQSGYSLPIEKRSVKTLPSRFELIKSNTTVVYLLKIESDNTLYAAFALGENDFLDRYWYKLYGFTLLALGVFLGLAIYNGFLFVSTKDKAYLFYLLYTIGLASYDLFDTGIASLFYGIIGNDISRMLVYIKAFELINLIFFTIYFLQLSSHNPWYRRFLLLWISMLPIMSYLYLEGIGRNVTLILINLTTYFLLYIGFNSYQKGYKPALFYLIATGGGLVLMSIFFLMPLGIIPLSLTGVNLINVAIVWDMIMFSLALAYRIKILQQEHEEQERLLIMKSRQYSIGEFSGNIAHQWRAPLNQIGSVLTTMEAKLRYATLSKEETLNALTTTRQLIRHLSDTIETFQGFFQNVKSTHLFNVNDEILKSIEFISESLYDNNIEIQYELIADIQMHGNANELTQVILNIVLNAKDILIQNQIIDPYIKISLTCDEKEFVISICDNGGGIKMDPIDSIFDPFVTEKEQGTGMGLFIAKMIVEKKLNGTLSVENAQKGALFKISFKN